jgi:hypothetical protein
MTLTYGQQIASLHPGRFIRLEKIARGGSLEARRLTSGNVMFYWRHTEGGKTQREPIGPYDSLAPPKGLKPTAKGYSVAAATEAARELAKENAETPGGLREKREQEATAVAALKHAEEARQRYTLKGLCAEYVAWLKSREKASWREAEIIFTNHLTRPFPELASTAASKVEKRSIVEVVRKLTEAAKDATARKLRSYLRAAYACAVRADSDPALPSSFIAYSVTTNLVESIAAIRGKAAKNPLSAVDLRRYLQALQEEPGAVGAALRLHVLSGAQRVAQLARLHARDMETDTIRLMDVKGRRSEPRAHLVPITRPMRTELAQLSRHGFVLSTDGGKTPMHPTSLSAWAADVGRRANINGFQLKRVRSGVETALASAGIPLHIRGQLQSHGISGVQATHYDAHEYLPEKRAALDALHGLLQQKPAKNVTSKKRARY